MMERVVLLLAVFFLASPAFSAPSADEIREQSEKEARKNATKQKLFYENFFEADPQKIKAEYRSCVTDEDCGFVSLCCYQLYSVNNSSKEMIETAKKELMLYCLAIACNPQPPKSQCIRGLCERPSSDNAAK